MHAVDVSDHVLEHVADVLRADEDGPGSGKRLLSPVRELLVAAHRILELGAVRLDRVARAACGRHGPAEQNMVGEDEIGGQVLAKGLGVRVHVALALGGGQIGKAAHLESLVAIEDEDGQQAADVRPHDLGAAQVVLLGARLLREDDDLVAGVAPGARERTRVDVGARPSEEVSVPEQNSHGRIFTTSSEQGRP